MTVFASTSPEHFEGTIEYGDCRIHGEECYGCVYAAPDHEAPYRQHNPPNPLLVLFRKQRTPLVPLKQHVRGMLNGLGRLLGESVDGHTIFTTHHDHARKVLKRLANLTKED